MYHLPIRVPTQGEITLKTKKGPHNNPRSAKVTQPKKGLKEDACEKDLKEDTCKKGLEEDACKNSTMHNDEKDDSRTK